MSLAGVTFGVIISAIDRISAPVRHIQGATSRLGQALERVSTKAALAGASLHGVAMATSHLSSRMQQIGMQAVHAFAAFDDARATIASMPGVTQATLDKMQAAAFAFTRQNRATLTDYYNTAYNILSAGIPEALATYATEVAIQVGQATRGSADEAGEAVAILFNNMRDGSRDAAGEFARMGDIITATQQRFQLRNLSQLTEGLKYATPAAKTARLAVDDMAAAVGRLNSAGLQGSMAGTALASMLANRFKAAQEIGFQVAVKKSTGELDLLRTLENLKRKIGDLNQLAPEMEDKLRKGFGEEGFRAVMLLLGQTDQLKEDLSAIRNSHGAAEAASRILNESAGAKWQQMLNRFEQLWIRLGEVLMPLKDAIGGALMAVADKIEAVITRFPDLARWVVGGVAALSSVAAAAGSALIAIGALGKLGKIRGILRILGVGKGAGGDITNIAGAAADAIGGVQKVWVVNMPGGGLSGALPDIGGADRRAEQAGRAARTLGGRLRSLMAGVMMQASLAWRTLVAWGGKVAAIASTAWGAIASGAVAAGRAVLLVGRAMLTTPIGLVLTAIAGAAYLVWRNWESIGPRLAAVWQTVKEGFASAWQWVAALPGRMIDVGRQIIDGLAAGIRGRWQALKDGVRRIAVGITDTMRGALGIRSPSRVFAEIGGHLMDGLKMGIERAAAIPLAAVHAVAAGIAAVPMAIAAPAVGQPKPLPDALTAASVAPTPIALTAASVAPTPIALPVPAPAVPQPRATAPAVGYSQPHRQMAPSIQITVNLQGPATPQSAQDVAAAVRREVERALADVARRDRLTRRALLIDG
ncbi:MAG: hypothetical protein KatS3mg124_1829 [Porticoccaceae bacterium]|nr:MAG: hypothetical protein KatS3mg124_1829 [Porticoccaceae bacterium]